MDQQQQPQQARSSKGIVMAQEGAEKILCENPDLATIIELHKKSWLNAEANVLKNRRNVLMTL